MVASGVGLDAHGKEPFKKEDVTLGKQIHLSEFAFPNLGE